MSVSLSIKTIFGVIIAGILILFVLLPLGVMLYKIFYNGEDQGTIESLTRLSAAIEQIETTQDVAIYIKKGLSIVGFEREKGTLINTCGWKYSTLLKPPICGNEACICICEEKSCTDARQCIPLENIKCFSTEGSTYGDSSCGNKQLVLQGCGFQKFGVRKLTLIKSGDVVKVKVSEKQIEDSEYLELPLSAQG